MQPIETLEVEGLTVRLYPEEDIPEAPWDWDTAVLLVTTDNRHFDPRTEIGGHIVRPDDVEPDKDGQWEGYDVFPLFAYIHSGVALSLGRSYPFDCPWDSGQIGYVLVSRSDCGVQDREGARKAAETFVEICNQYLCGDVYWFKVVLIEEDGEETGLDSCGGLYGWEYAVREATEAAQAVRKSLTEEDALLNRAMAL